MKKFALVVAAAAAIFAVLPASAQDMNRDGMRRGGMHQGTMHRGTMDRMRSHMRPHHRMMRPPMRHHHRGHMMH